MWWNFVLGKTDHWDSAESWGWASSASCLLQLHTLLSWELLNRVESRRLSRGSNNLILAGSPRSVGWAPLQPNKSEQESGKAFEKNWKIVWESKLTSSAYLTDTSELVTLNELLRLLVAELNWIISHWSVKDETRSRVWISSWHGQCPEKWEFRQLGGEEGRELKGAALVHWKPKSFVQLNASQFMLVWNVILLLTDDPPPLTALIRLFFFGKQVRAMIWWTSAKKQVWHSGPKVPIYSHEDETNHLDLAEHKLPRRNNFWTRQRIQIWSQGK